MCHLDWEKAWENRELVHYYQGLIALRKQISGLCDKSKDSYKEEYLDEGWEILSDANDSWCWEKGIYADRCIEVAPQSVLILGRK